MRHNSDSANYLYGELGDKEPCMLLGPAEFYAVLASIPTR